MSYYVLGAFSSSIKYDCINLKITFIINLLVIDVDLGLLIPTFKTYHSLYESVKFAVLLCEETLWLRQLIEENLYQGLTIAESICDHYGEQARHWNSS